MIRKAMRRPAVLAATGWSKASLYAKIAEGKFPAPMKLDPKGRAVIWFEDEVRAWQDSASQPVAPLVVHDDKHIASLAKSAKRIAAALESIDATLNRVTGKMDKMYGGGSFIRTSDIGD